MILITGVAGQIGRRMAQQFLDEGIDFIGIDYVNNPDLSEEQFREMDIRDPAVAELIESKGVDSIIHMAFCTKPKMDDKTRNDIDLNGSRNIADCAVKKGVKDIVFVSSCRVYGDLTKKGGTHDSEGNYLNPVDDIYAQNKIEAEIIFQKTGQDHGIKVAILRLAIVCWKGGGLGMGDMFKATSKNGRYFSFSAKNPPVQLVHVRDVINACRNAVGKEGIFDIASEGQMPLMDMFVEAAKLGGKKSSQIKIPEKLVMGSVWLLWKLGISPFPPLYVKMYGYDITRDISKTVRGLGKPEFTVHQILKEIVEW
jgi:UDP-glucose 4-epimerase